MDEALTRSGLRDALTSEHAGARLQAAEPHGVWIHRLGADALAAHLARIADLDRAHPLWGVPFAIKDNIDLAGAPTTAGCPRYAYAPERSATVVERLLAVGAIPVGKTNMDQFATGLVGTRSPYGATANALDPDYVSGGSSSGSAVAVKLGLAAFALGTDTAGSGRVPAAFNGLVGFKPTKGWWSTRGVVPACRTLDCVSVFANTVADARTVAEVAGGFDVDDPFSKALECADFDPANARYGFAPPDVLPFFGNDAYRQLYADFVAGLPNAQPVDPEPFMAAGKLLYDGPWLAERHAALGDFIASDPDAVLPVTRAVIEGGRRATAAECFRAQYSLARLKRQAEAVFANFDVLVFPTAPTIYRQAEVARDPFQTNANLGVFTNFVNLLDLCAIAIPAGTTASGLPFGVTLMAGAGYDYALLNAASCLRGEATSKCPGEMHIAVFGAHMTGGPLNTELVRRGGYLVSRTRTAPRYRLFALPDGRRPALVRTDAGGAVIEAEVWSLSAREVGGFLATIAPPLGLGSVELDAGNWVTGFVAEGIATVGATDITAFGGWRSYRARIADDRP